MKFKKQNLVILFFDETSSTPAFKVIAFNEVEAKTGINVDLEQNGLSCILSSQKRKIKVTAQIGGHLAEEDTKRDFKDKLPFGIFDRTNDDHMQLMIDVVREVTERIMA